MSSRLTAAVGGNWIRLAESAELALGLTSQGIGQLRVAFAPADRALHEIDFRTRSAKPRALAPA